MRAPLVDEIRDQSRPAGLMRCAEAFTGVIDGYAHRSAECFFQFAQRLDDQEARRKPYRSAPVAVAAFEFHDCFSGLVADRFVAEDEWVRLMEFAETAHAVR